MLTLILGRGKSGKTTRILEEIRRCPSGGMASRILIVPEQLSHQTERRLSAFCGDGISYYADVLSFTRLQNRVNDHQGGGARQVLDQGGRILTARLALQNIRSQLKVFASAALKTEFLTGMLSMIDELKSYDVSPDMLREAARQTQGVFSQKLLELSRILAAYNALLSRSACDPSDKLSLLAEQLSAGDYAAGRSFFIDGFSDFSGLELQVIGALLRRECPVWLTLPLDPDAADGALFAPAGTAMARLMDLASRAGQEVRVETVAYDRPIPPALTYLDRNLFTGGGAAFPGDSGAVRLYQAPDRLTECRHCAAELRRMAETGVRWRDMAVACGDSAAYGPMMEAVCREYGVPLFTSVKAPITGHPAVAFVLGALESASEGMDTDTVLACLRTGYSGLSPDACDRLENYAVTWSVRGQKWFTVWAEHPEGYDGKFGAEVEQELEELNTLRERAVGPLGHLGTALKSAGNTRGQILGLYRFMEETDLFGQISRRVTELTETGEQELAQQTAQVWNTLLECLQQTVSVLGETAQNSGELLKLLRVSLSKYTLGTIPPVLDAVAFGGVDAVRGLEPKAVFILGANEGVLPGAPAGGSLLTEQERSYLRDRLDISLAPDSEGALQRQLLQIYGAMTAPTACLTVSWVTGGREGQAQPSYLVERLMGLFPGSPVCVPSDGHGDAMTVESLTELYFSAEETGEMALAESLRRTAGQWPALENAIVKARSEALQRELNVSRELSQRLFGSPVVLTASRLDELGNCPLSFFLNYGIKARARKEASFDAAEFGTFLHYILEKTVAQMVDGDLPLPLEEPVSQALVEENMEPYLAQRVRDEETLSVRQQYLYRRNSREAGLLLREISQELSVSRFRPCAYELQFGEGKGLGPLTIRSELGQGRLDGTVDRVDLWRGPDGDYFRIIDYKSGTKRFDYTDLRNSVGMQLFLYMFALRRRGVPGAAQAHPAGALYMPAKRSFISVDEPVTAEGAESEHRRSGAKRSGLLLDSDPVLEAMEEGGGGCYLPVKRKKDGTGDYMISPGQMDLLEQFIGSRMRMAVDRIYAGDFAPEPYYRGRSHDPCQWCDYGDICQKDAAFRRRHYHKSVSPKEFWNELGGEENG